ncbi:sulfotransferase [Streptomyces europaeiscabiei]|uniref:sulfotransferase family protein n=1 Tax=Streptomyces TaxID=1883 RepID=UPI000A3B6C2F|nr:MULTISPECIES: sulfotransferase [Streptomyces]MDX3615369.1 sulfotransferase [Streptomyces europaeiscabiei]MDX3629159.1 sulfotransferase [Streptomyces europaeiscabiei]MDX3647223.1 sulfotransferase [Streptomyces europaeiscabiei]
MSLMRNLNRALTATTGLQVRRAPAAAPAAPRATPPKPAVKKPTAVYRCPAPEDLATDRLLRQPVFIMSPVRSGSTLLRMLMNAHPRLHSPHELHIRRLEVGYGSRLSQKAMSALDLERGDLEHLLWDRVMHRELVRSGKDFVVEKTPSNAFVYERIRDCWPDARFVFLLRHPVSIAQSWHEGDPDKRTYDEAATDALRYMKAVDKARKALTGHTVRYEDITAEPEKEMRRLCDFLDIAFEPAMLDYGRKDDAQVVKGLGDWRDKIRTGQVQAGRALPAEDDIPEILRPMCRAWGYGK